MLDPDALDRLHRFAAEVDRAVPGTLAGVYAVGSLALGDWRPETSNLDVLAVADRPWTSAGVAAALPAARRSLGQGLRPPAVAWLSWADLAGDPTDSSAPCTLGPDAVATSRLVNPLTWQILQTSAICLRGPEYPDLGSGHLRRWARHRLTQDWPVDLERWRRPGRLWWRATVATHVLDAARLWAAVGSGRVLAKAEAVDALWEGAVPQHRRVLRDAAGWRAGASTSMYWGPLERKRDALGWLRATVDAAGRDGDDPEGDAPTEQ